jgi:hypothetical protein
MKLCFLIFFSVIFSSYVEKEETTGIQTPCLCWNSVPYYCFSYWFCICVVPTTGSSGMFLWMCTACTECPLYFFSEHDSCHRVRSFCDKVVVLGDSDALNAMVL